MSIYLSTYTCISFKYQYTIIHIYIRYTIRILRWTLPRVIDPLVSEPMQLDMLTEEGSLGVVLTMLMSVVMNTRTVDVSLFSSAMVCDRTGGLGVSVWSRRAGGKSGHGAEMVRNTFRAEDGSSLVRSLIHQSEKTRRLAIATAEIKSKTLKSASSSHTYQPLKGDGEDGRGGAGLAVDSDPVLSLQVTISDLSVQSTHTYEVVQATVGDKVYSDRSLRWSHLPQQLRGQQYIRTPCDDQVVRSNHLLSFVTSGPSLVMVLVDMRAAVKSEPPKWLKQDGYHRISDQAIARTAVNGALHETFYGIYGKYYDQGNVVLRGNWSKQVYSMWTCFIVPIPLSLAMVLSPSLPGLATARSGLESPKSGK